MAIKAEQKILTPQEVRGAVHGLRRKLVQEGVPVARVLLFGSYARGKAHCDSDIDVAVVVPFHISACAQKKIHFIPWWAKQIHVKLEPHLLSEGDYKNTWLSLSAEVRRYGVPVK